MPLTLRQLLADRDDRLAAVGLNSLLAASPSLARLVSRLHGFSPSAIEPAKPDDPSLDAIELAEYLDRALPANSGYWFVQRMLRSPSTQAELKAVQEWLNRPTDESPTVENSTIPAPVPPPLPATCTITSTTSISTESPATCSVPPPLPVISPTPVLMAQPIAIATTPSVVDPNVEVQESRLDWLLSPTSPLQPALVSMVVHTILLIALALLLLPGNLLTSAMSELVVTVEKPSLPSDAMRLMTSATDAHVSMSLNVGLFGGSAQGGAPIASDAAEPKPVERGERIAIRSNASTMSSPIASSDLMSGWNREFRPMRKPTEAAEGGLIQAAGAEQAVDGILGKIRGELESDDLLVVWMLDASLSLVDDRQRVAARIEPFYREFDGRRAQSQMLMNAAVAYGQSAVELAEPTRFGLKMVDAMLSVPIDTSGLENVMTAIELSIAKYRKRWKKPIMFVIWTDESGDDILRLEQTISLCRQERVVVHVVGPCAVFGAERGSHLYVDPPTGYRFLLPIKCGPDSSLPQRAWLPYWYESALAPWSRGGAVVADAASGSLYGGMYRERLLSGVGPYAMTRLALQTGGTFTMLNPDEAGQPFQIASQLAYLPDYGPASAHLDELKYHPLRKAITEVVRISYQEQPKLIPPTFDFIAERNEFYPFNILPTRYMPPAEFRAELRNSLVRESQRMKASAAIVDEALLQFGPNGMEDYYEREKSARWRAWYDLTVGRLLATSVRQQEYLKVCELVFNNQNYLNADTNRLVFSPSPSMQINQSSFIKRKAEAERLLKRCVEGNPNTPWQLLAQWELERPLGLGARQIAIPPPPPPRPGAPPPPGRAPAPVPRLPSL